MQCDNECGVCAGAHVCVFVCVCVCMCVCVHWCSDRISFECFLDITRAGIAHW